VSTTHLVYSSSSSSSSTRLRSGTAALIAWSVDDAPVVGPVSVAVDVVASGDGRSDTRFFGSMPIFAIQSRRRSQQTRPDALKGTIGLDTYIDQSFQVAVMRLQQTRREAVRQLNAKLGAGCCPSHRAHANRRLHRHSWMESMRQTRQKRTNGVH
jgi:hypothetical protein